MRYFDFTGAKKWNKRQKIFEEKEDLNLMFF